MKNSILAITIALFITSCGEKKSDKNTHIIGTIKGFSNGMVYLQKMNDSAFVAVDSVKIESNGNFKFDLNLDSPEMVYLEINRGVTNSIDNNLPVFAEPGTINIDTELKYFFANAKVTGSKNHELYEQFEKINTKYKVELLQISKEKGDALRFNRPQDLDSINQKFNNKIIRKYLYAINFALTNKEYEVAPFVAISQLNDANIKYLDTIANAMPPKIASSKYGTLLSKYIADRKKME